MLDTHAVAQSLTDAEFTPAPSWTDLAPAAKPLRSGRRT